MYRALRRNGAHYGSTKTLNYYVCDIMCRLRRDLEGIYSVFMLDSVCVCVCVFIIGAVTYCFVMQKPRKERLPLVHSP